MTTPNTPEGQFPQQPPNQGEPSNWQGTPATDGQYQPAPEQQYAQPDYQQGQSYQGSAMGQPLQAEPKRSKGGVVGRIVTTLIVVVVLAGVGLLARGFISDALNSYPELQPGKCVVFEGTVADLKHKEVDCDDPAVFKYEIAKVFDKEDTPDCSEYGTYTIEQEKYGSNETLKTVCIMEKFEADSCYEQTQGVEDYKLISCPSELSLMQFKVTTVVDQANASCADGELAVSYPDPARTYCVVAGG